MPAKQTLILLLVGALLVAAVLFLGEDLKSHIHGIESWLSNLGPFSKGGLILLFAVLTTLFVPESILSVIAGSVFGLWQGILLAALGNVLGVGLQYVLARRILPRAVSRLIRLNPSLQALQKVIASSDIRLQALVRMTPTNPAIVSYILAAGGVPFRSYMVASFAFLPHIVADVYVGFAGMHVLKRVSGAATEANYLHDAVVAAGLVISAVAIALVTRRASAALKGIVSGQSLDRQRDLPVARSRSRVSGE